MQSSLITGECSLELEVKQLEASNLEQADESAFVELIPLICMGDITLLLSYWCYASKVGRVRRSFARQPAFLCVSCIPSTEAHERVLNVQVEF